MARILTEGGARRGFELLDESGLLSDILPEVAAMKGVAQPPRIPSGGRRVDAHADAARKLEHPRSPWRWELCCTTWASRRPSA